MIKHFFIPTEHNKYTPHLLHRKTLVIYLVLMVLFNFVFVNTEFATVSASVDAGTLYSLHNQQRSANGLTPLTQNSRLVSSATAKAKAMLDSDCWSHYCPPGTSPWTFILNAGYDYVYAGENLAEGFSDNNAVMNAWMNSPTHRANIVNANFKEIGIGFATGTYQGKENNTIIVVHFGATAAAPAPTAAPTAVPPTSAPAAEPVVEPTSFTQSNPVTPTQVFQPQNIEPTPAPTEVPLVLDQPVTNNTYTEKQPLFSGSSPLDAVVEIIANEEIVGSQVSEGATFSFRPQQDLQEGENIVYTRAQREDATIAETETITINIDTTPPVVERDSLQVNIIANLDAPKATLELSTSGDVAEMLLQSDDNTYKFQPQSEAREKWSLIISKTDLEKLPDDIVIEAKDEAGNSREIIISKAQILGLFEEQQQLLTAPVIQSSGSLFSNFSSQFGMGTDRARVNIMFIAVLILLFTLDFLVLHKSGLTGKIHRSKSHLHLSIFVILLVISLLGSIGGRIL